MAIPDPGSGLLGRQIKRGALDMPASAVRAGESQALVLRGEAGAGKLPTPQPDAPVTAIGVSAVIVVSSLVWSFDGCDRTLDPRAQRESDDSICDSSVAAREWLGRWAYARFDAWCRWPLVAIWGEVAR